MDGPVAHGFDVTQEVRIASVMFGGVSLAVYMNGISQELLRAVRATAPRPAPPSTADKALGPSKRGPGRTTFCPAMSFKARKVYTESSASLSSTAESREPGCQAEYPFVPASLSTCSPGRQPAESTPFISPKHW